MGVVTNRMGAHFCASCTAEFQRIRNLEAVTVSEALQRFQPRSLDSILPGSWINANFDIWIGAEEDNHAWEHLLDARRL